jgi:hypothetical protein
MPCGCARTPRRLAAAVAPTLLQQRPLQGTQHEQNEQGSCERITAEVTSPGSSICSAACTHIVQHASHILGPMHACAA